jgi:hypothetical protein
LIFILPHVSWLLKEKEIAIKYGNGEDLDSLFACLKYGFGQDISCNA